MFWILEGIWLLIFQSQGYFCIVHLFSQRMMSWSTASSEKLGPSRPAHTGRVQKAGLSKYFKSITKSGQIKCKQKNKLKYYAYNLKIFQLTSENPFPLSSISSLFMSKTPDGARDSVLAKWRQWYGQVTKQEELVSRLLPGTSTHPGATAHQNRTKANLQLNFDPKLSA